MPTDPITRLNHMRDFGPREAESSVRASNAMMDVLGLGGFQRLDTPVIEPTDLFVRKSGGEVSSSLYSFKDPGGMSVSLRPEFTPSIIRWHIENASETDPPHRYRYSGPVFRYAGARKGRFRQFQQVGAELIGVPDADGDAEIITAAVRCLRSAGVERSTIRLGHIGMVHDMVQSQGLSDQVEMFIISNLHQIVSEPDCIERLTESAIAAGLVIEETRAAPFAAGLHEAMPELEIVRRSISGPTGRRSPGQILSRLATRMERACSRADFIAALQKVSSLISLSGTTMQVIADAEGILKSNRAALDSARELRATLRKLAANGVSESAIRLDLSFVRGMTYYTGIVFEFLGGDGREEDGYPIGGGGRYDYLVSAFGGDQAPSCGFALYVDEVVRTIHQQERAKSL